MNRLTIALGSIISLAVCTMALGQEGGPPGAPGYAPAPAVPDSAQKMESTVLPDISSDSPSLDDAINLLRDKLPGFNAVVVRGQRVSPDYPALPSMKMKSITLGQYLQFLRSFPGVTIERIDGPNGPLYSIRINAAEGVPVPFRGPPGYAPGGAFAPSPAAAPAPDIPHVKIYYLAEIVEALASGPDHEQDALNDLASLVSQTLGEVDEKTPSEIKVHAATRVLIFRGGPEKMAVLDQLLSTLTPKSDPDKAKLNDQFQQFKMDAKLQVEEADRRIQQMNDELTRAQNEIRLLKVKLMSENATTRP